MPALSPSFLGVNSANVPALSGANVFYPMLLAMVLLLSLHDLYHARVPNWVTLPLMGIGLLWNFPGALETWLACLLLFAAWRAGWLGGGDAKLWMALLWLAPGVLAQTAVLVMSGAFVLTALAQILWRKFCKTPLTVPPFAHTLRVASMMPRTPAARRPFRPRAAPRERRGRGGGPGLSARTGCETATNASLHKSPGAWRTIPYAIWLCTLPISGWLF